MENWLYIYIFHWVVLGFCMRSLFSHVELTNTFSALYSWKYLFSWIFGGYFYWMWNSGFIAIFFSPLYKDTIPCFLASVVLVRKGICFSSFEHTVPTCLLYLFALYFSSFVAKCFGMVFSVLFLLHVPSIAN